MNNNNNNNNNNNKIKIPTSPIKQLKGKDLIKVPAKLFLFNEIDQIFQFQQDVIASLKSLGDGKQNFQFTLTLTNPKTDELIFSQEVDNNMFMHFNEESSSIIWLYTLGNQVWTWSLVFENKETDYSFKGLFAKCIWEKNAQKPFGKNVKEDELEWLVQAFDDNIKMEEDDGMKECDLLDFIDDLEKEERKKEDEEDEEDEDEEDEDEEDEEDEESENSEYKDEEKEKNKFLAKNDRSFVVRGSKIGVFKHTPDNKLKYTTTIDKIKTKEGNKFSPKKLQLHQEDTSMLLLHPDKKDKIFKMDLTRGDIVEEWKVHENYTVHDLFPINKYAERTPEPTILGLNNLGFMLMDPRLPKEKVVDSRSYFYKPSSRPKLSCAATTGKGQMVIGTENGDIRLYSAKTLLQEKKDIEQGPRAKTQLPGFGEPIIGIDVTEDGSWILATCKTYLLVIPTTMKNGSLGFEVSMGKEKPAPRRLQLKKEHVAMMGGYVHFTPAHFNTGPSQERFIATSTGPFVITWNFRKVKQNKLDEYQIKKCKEDVIADQFRYGNEQAIVVTTPNDVTIARKVPISKT